ncbi:adenylyltransferase/cytidyltransferase family protein [Nocardioides convexus]|uniref:adenylyltransferase/cytidyltransferase family protein n=1 Tax=Nocardioides convexus TaxID=2712224 RepID=UPI003100F398
MPEETDWRAALRDRGYRLTPQREPILAAVDELGHATPDEVLAKVQETASTVNASTVYRTLEVLEEARPGAARAPLGPRSDVPLGAGARALPPGLPRVPRGHLGRCRRGRTVRGGAARPGLRARSRAPDRLRPLRRLRGRTPMTTVLTYGTFDLFHIGHLRLIERLAAMGDRLIVGVSTDEFNAGKGKRSVVSYDDRAAIVQSIKGVDLVLPERSLGAEARRHRRARRGRLRDGRRLGREVRRVSPTFARCGTCLGPRVSRARRSRRCSVPWTPCTSRRCRPRSAP